MAVSVERVGRQILQVVQDDEKQLSASDGRQMECASLAGISFIELKTNDSTCHANNIVKIIQSCKITIIIVIILT